MVVRRAKGTCLSAAAARGQGMRDAMRVAVIVVAMLGRRTSQRSRLLYGRGKRRRTWIGRMRMVKILRPWSSMWKDRADGLLENGGGVHLRIKTTVRRGLWLAEPLSLAIRSGRVGEGRGGGRRPKSRDQSKQRDVSARLSKVDIESRRRRDVIGRPVGMLLVRYELWRTTMRVVEIAVSSVE